MPAYILNPFAIPDTGSESRQSGKCTESNSNSKKRVEELVEASRRRAEIQSNIVKTIYTSSGDVS